MHISPPPSGPGSFNGGLPAQGWDFGLGGMGGEGCVTIGKSKHFTATIKYVTTATPHFINGICNLKARHIFMIRSIYPLGEGPLGSVHGRRRSV